MSGPTVDESSHGLAPLSSALKAAPIGIVTIKGLVPTLALTEEGNDRGERSGGLGLSIREEGSASD